LAITVILAVVFLRTPPTQSIPTIAPLTRPTTIAVREKSLLLTVNAPVHASLNQPYRITCQLKNLGNGTQSYLETGARREFSVNVFGPSGIPPERTTEGLSLADDANTKKTHSRLLQPGEEISQQYDLTRIFALSRKTRYTVTVSKHLNEFIRDPNAVHQLKLEFWFETK
jgi:hypothetical protein